MVHRGWMKPRRPPSEVPARAYQLALGGAAVVYAWRERRRWLALVKRSKHGEIFGFFACKTRNSVARAATAFWKEWR